MSPHVLVLPFPIQGHINPMLQFAKRLASKGPQVTLVTTNFIIKSIQQLQTKTINLATISDGYDDTGIAGATDGFEPYFESLQTIGSKTLEDLITKQSKSDHPFTCMVYDTYVPWAAEVTKKLGSINSVAFSTQSCAVSSIYYHFNHGLLDLPDNGDTVSLHGLARLGRSDFPSFTFGAGDYATLARLSLNQFNAPKKTDWVLFNSFDDLEDEVMIHLKEQWHARTIGPTVPSKFIEGDNNNYYGMNLIVNPENDLCVKWLETKPCGSTVYVSFGSVANLSKEQTEEIAFGLKQSGKCFLWVVRASEQEKLPKREEFIEEDQKGLIVAWSPQLEVLSHEAVGCFLTHCGWNSTLEALSMGVPMVGVPQWTDQPTNARYVEDVWRVGVRVHEVDDDEKKVVRRGEISRCIREVMDGERSEEMKRNAKRWKELAQRALSDGGSSDHNLNDFVEFLINGQGSK